MQDFEDSKKQIFLKALGKVIQKLRKEKNLSSRDIAYGVDLSKTSILLAEKGLLDPQITTFYKIAEAFGLEPETLLKQIKKELPQNFTFCE